VSEGATGTAETEYRQAADMRRESEFVHQDGIERRRSDAGGGDRHHIGNVLATATGFRQGRCRCFLKQGHCVFEIELIALCPAMGLAVPVDRHAGATRLDAGIVEDWHQMINIRIRAIEQDRCDRRDFRLLQQEGRYRRGYRQDSGGEF
jgi:hypothetical protein